MAVHQFGLLPCAPRPGDRFDRYEPEKYQCIAVRDDWLDDLLISFKRIRTYWHSPDLPSAGLDEAGITLIPPHSAGQMVALIGEAEEMTGLKRLLSEAEHMQSWMIHFGI